MDNENRTLYYLLSTLEVCALSSHQARQVTVIVDNAIDAKTTNWDHQDIPTNDMVAESRPLYLLASTTTPSTHQCSSSTTVTVPSQSVAKLRIIRRLYMYAKPKWGMINALWPYEPSYTSYGCGESTSTAPTLPHEDTSSTVPTQP